MASGNLQISVVEGKNFVAERGTPVPYIVLELGSQKVETEPKSGDAAPRWLKDFKLPVYPDDKELKVSVVDNQNKEEGAFGVATVAMSDVIGGGTMVKWYDLKNPGGDVVGELCLVLRHMELKTPAAAPASPAPTPAPAPAPPAANGSAAAPSPDAKAETKVLLQELPGQGAVVPQEDTPAPAAAAPPAAPAAAPATPPPAAPAPTPTPAPAAPAAASPAPPSPATPAPAPAPAANGSAAAEKSSGSKSGGGSGFGAGLEGGAIQKLLAVGGAIVAVAVASVLLNKRQTKPQFYKVKEGDTFCSIAGCYGLSPSQVIKANSTVDDPDRIYPGDRIYIP